MKQLIYLAALSLIPAMAMAQKSFDEDVNSELDQMYNQSQPAQRNTRPSRVNEQVQIVQVPAQQQAAPQYYAQPAPQPVYQAPAQVQVQKTTLVEASPLTESRADKMRKQREETELQTEQKIVEKLEISRMEDEKHRAEILFGDKFNTLQNPQAQQPVAVVPAPVAAPVVVAETKVVEAPVAHEEKKEEERLNREAVRQEISAALDESKAKDEAKKSERKSYVSLAGGMDNYSNNNIKPQYSFGVGFGQKINDRMLVEGQFNYSDAHVQQQDGYNAGYYGVYPRISDMQAYQGLIEVKYEILGGTFRPLVGAAAAYTYRKYQDIQFGSPNDTGSSSAIDLGLLAGADMTVSENLAIGFEVRYLWNLANQTQANNSLTPAYSNTNAATPENMGNMNMSLVGRMSF